MIAQQPTDQPLAGYTVRSALAAPDREAAEWDGMLPGSAGDFYLCYDWLASIRGTKGYDEQTWSIYDRNGHLAGLVPIYTTPEPVNNQFYDLYALFGGTPGAAAGERAPAGAGAARPDRPRETPAEATGKSAWAPQLLVGSRAGYTNAPMIRDRALLPVWAATAAQAAREIPCGSAAIPYVEKALARDLLELLPGSCALLCGGGCRVSLQQEDFETYLSRLARSRRRIIRADLRRFGRSDRAITTHKLEENLVEPLLPLLLNVQHRHGSSVTRSQVADFLRSCAVPGLGDRSVVFICWQGDDPIGFCLAFEYGSSLTIRVVGLDYGRVGQYAEYFMLLVHEPVQYALSRGLTTVDLGMESYAAKLLRGGALVPLWSLLLASPVPWDSETAYRYNAKHIKDWRESFGTLVGDLDALTSLDAM